MTIRTLVDGERPKIRRLGAQREMTTVSNRLPLRSKFLPIPRPPPSLKAPQETAEAVIGATTPTMAMAGAMGVQKLLLPPEVAGASLRIAPQAGEATRVPRPSSSTMTKLVLGAVLQARSLVLLTILGLVATQV